MKLYIDFGDSGLHLRDFHGMVNMEQQVLKKIKDKKVGDEIWIDRPTHSTAMESFEITEMRFKIYPLFKKINLIRLKHTGGAS